MDFSKIANPLTQLLAEDACLCLLMNVMMIFARLIRHWLLRSSSNCRIGVFHWDHVRMAIRWGHYLGKGRIKCLLWFTMVAKH